ncbi:MAG TPA: hypothetical protein VKU38_14270 [Ktedonobacteraceae bacterium]|nr:hypothetical protein [Ktedonobacteraceae bacterium]
MQQKKTILRRVSIAVGAFLISIPLLVAILNNTYDPQGEAFVILTFLVFWTFTIALVSQSRKVFFWGAAVIVWLLGFMIAIMANSPVWLMIPLGLSVILGSLYSSIVGQHIRPMPHEASHPQQPNGTVVNNYISVYTHPQGATHTYQQGYQGTQPSQPIQPVQPIHPTGPMYAEGEKLYSYPHALYEQPQVQYPPEKQQ